MRLLTLWKMNTFLKEVRDKLIGKKSLDSVFVVIGNESVDLDSAVSSISLAYHLSQSPNSHIIAEEFRNSSIIFAPVINAVKEQVPIKTEVTFWLKEHGIDPNVLITRDELDLSKIDKFILVDHHVSDEFRDRVIGVLDHRPFDVKSNLNPKCFKNIQEVGSCATLVGDSVRKDSSEHNKEIYHLLYGPIVLDTINFSKSADKARPLDEDVGMFIEKLLDYKNVHDFRKKTYEDLVNARADISTLSSSQLLHKDLKIISNEDEKFRLAIPGVPVFKYITMENAEESVKKFADSENLDVVVLMGMKPVGDSIERFIGVINIKNKKLYEDVSECQILLLINFYTYISISRSSMP